MTVHRDRAEYKRQYREANKEEIKQKQRQYYLQNKARINEKNRKWHHSHKEQVYIQKKAYEAKNKVRLNQYRRGWYEKNKHLIARSTDKLKENIFHILGHVCVKCGQFDKRCLHIDHIDGGGGDDRRKHGGQEEMYAYYNEYPEQAKQNLQVLCANCNWIKRYENDEINRNRRKSKILDESEGTDFRADK